MPAPFVFFDHYRLSSISASSIIAMPAICFFAGRSLKRRVLTSITTMIVPVLKTG